MKKNYIQPKAELVVSHMHTIMGESTIYIEGESKEPIEDDDPDIILNKTRNGEDYGIERMSLW